MAEHATHEIERQDVVHHEESDVNIRAIFGFGAGLLTLGAVIYVVVWLLFAYFDRREDSAASARTYPLAVGQENRLPPEPRLQVNPRQDLKDLRTSEEERLNSYQWVDRNGGVVRIPIEEAMRLTLERGLPSRQQPREVPR